MAIIIIGDTNCFLTKQDISTYKEQISLPGAYSGHNASIVQCFQSRFSVCGYNCMAELELQVAADLSYSERLSSIYRLRIGF